MRTKIALLAVVTAAIGALAAATGSQATTKGVDLAIVGTVVAGVTSSQPGQELPFLFTITNHSATAPADLSFYFTVTNATADGSDYVCPTLGHVNINPDTPACEPGRLGAGKSSSAAIMVTPTAAGTVTVKACAQDLSGSPDPVSRNDCKTLSVTIV
jgi:hypothetical protein